MKPILIFLFSILTISAYGQDKYNYIYTKKPIELKGTEYVLSRVENWGKMFVVQNQYLLFINTQNGQSKKVDFPKECRIQRVEQIEIDSLQINKIIVMANTLNLDNSKHLDGGDPMQIFLLSINGEEKAQLTDNAFFVHDFTINSKTGNIVVTGIYDTNGNGKYNKTDEYQILLYDLKTLKLISRVNQ